ncbi:MBL fold metallo-hydrolase [Euryarchaeota archaeon]|nr:MBL fold metallo-hydrolase [Euryarchaeota archaeon]MDA8594821.1 MBL fold metallo-hydrolase [Euryarchaeota archaeon]MDA8690257.1 MBL fold metallo-hydrolase [Euryarchaeota archaeon]MDA8700878.1 MBL fold metallo-hydrolase [Euryarchaeota archaeon]MDC3237023.1 MBL fold metallo-hydrolase [Candidatus Poseidoniaceae archaeon]
MTMVLTHLGTGSRGNATLLETEHAKVLIDQGFSGAQLEKRLARLNIHPTEIDFIFISHHHGDHGGGALVAQKRWKMKVQANHRTAEELGLQPELTHYFDSLDLVKVSDDLSVLPVPVPHSGADNVAFVASHNGQRAAVITDLGSWTDELVTHVRGCEHIAIEANYDHNRLMNGPYPFSLKDRISGRGGHLSNDQTGEFLAQVCTPATRSISLTHLSEKNNQPHLAESTVLYHIDEIFSGDISISLQDGPEHSHYIGRTAEESDASHVHSTVR